MANRSINKGIEKATGDHGSNYPSSDEESGTSANLSHGTDASGTESARTVSVMDAGSGSMSRPSLDLYLGTAGSSSKGMQTSRTISAKDVGSGSSNARVARESTVGSIQQSTLNFRSVAEWFNDEVGPSHAQVQSPGRLSPSYLELSPCQPSTSYAYVEIKQEVMDEEDETPMDDDDDVIFIGSYVREIGPIISRKRLQTGAGTSGIVKKKKKGSDQQEEHSGHDEDRPCVDLTRMTTISEPTREFSKTLKMRTTNHALHFTPNAAEFDGPPEDLIDAAVAGLFKEVVCREKCKDSDQFGIDFWWPGMKDAKFITFRPIDSFDETAVRLEMLKVMQSGSPNIDLTQQGRITFIMVDNAIVGSGRAAHNGGSSEGSNITSIPGSRGEFHSLRKNPRKLNRAALKLMQEAGVHKLRQYGTQELEKFQAILPNHQIKVFRGLRRIWHGPYKGEDDKYHISLRLEKGHFDHIKRVARFLNSRYYCHKCQKCFSNREDHYVCNVRYRRCWHFNTTDCEGTESLSCEDCQMPFKSKACLGRHSKLTEKAEKTGKAEKTAYTENRICRNCKKPMFTRTGERVKHECNKPYCRICCENKPEDHANCYQRPLKETEEDFEARTIFFDLESTFEDERSDGRIYHKVNLCIAYKCYRNCWNDTPATRRDVPKHCETCGDDRLMIWNNFADPNIDPVKCFVEWLDEQQNLLYTIVAHNFKGYDGHFVLQQVLRQSDDDEDCTYEDEPIISGNHIMTAKVGRTRAVDSHNFIPCALSSFVKQFDLGEERKKGYFPHLFNKAENYDYDGPMPALEIEDFFKNAGVWPLHECLTAASAALKCYRRRFMKKDTMIADRPTCLKRRQSALALKFFSWLLHSENEVIQDAYHGGEKKVGQYYVDGFIENGGRGVAIEVKGCYFHQHTCRYDEDSEMRGEKAPRIWLRDAEREKYIEKRHDLKIYWECEIEKMMRMTPGMAEFMNNLIIYDPLEMRSGFCGGRTEAYALRCEVEQDSHFEIKYLDFCSLYPNENKKREYPCGGMRTIPREELPSTTISTVDQLKMTDGTPLKGFLFCRAPRRVHVPALPARKFGKLLFALCNKFCDERADSFCTHSDSDRLMTGVWATVELEMAIEECGYEIVECIEAVHYDKWIVYEKDEETGEVLQHGLYSEYMDSFLRLKAQALGWPSGVTTDDEKDAYLLEFMKKEGVQLDKAVLEKGKNAPARASAKLALNSLWGKTGENPVRTKTLITSKYEKFWRLITRPGVTVQSLLVLNDSNRVKIKYKQETVSTEPLISNSIAVACLTTAYARVRLYSALKRIRPDRLLYADTDSIIFLHDRREENPLQSMMGSALGELTDELPEGSRCTGFISQGPKVYALKIMDEASDKVTESVKCRGFTLTAEAENVVNYCKISEHVDALIAKEPVVPTPVRYFRISTDREHAPYTHYQIKGFRPVYDKRLILPDGSTRPIGWCAE